jgi:hypothetical protein
LDLAQIAQGLIAAAHWYSPVGSPPLGLRPPGRTALPLAKDQGSTPGANGVPPSVRQGTMERSA